MLNASRIPRLVFLDYIGAPLESWAKKRELKRHKAYSREYCRAMGTMKIVRVVMHEPMESYFISDRTLYMKCTVCSKEDDFTSMGGNVGQFIAGKGFFLRHGEGTIAFCIILFACIVASAVSVPLQIAQNRMVNRLVQADRTHIYSPKDKGVQCNRTADSTSGRKWGSCEVVSKDGIGIYTVKYKQWNKDGIETFANFRALDMSPAKK